jgi:hypothetical protein
MVITRQSALNSESNKNPIFIGNLTRIIIGCKGHNAEGGKPTFATLWSENKTSASGDGSEVTLPPPRNNRKNLTVIRLEQTGHAMDSKSSLNEILALGWGVDVPHDEATVDIIESEVPRTPVPCHSRWHSLLVIVSQKLGKSSRSLVPIDRHVVSASLQSRGGAGGSHYPSIVLFPVANPGFQRGPEQYFFMFIDPMENGGKGRRLKAVDFSRWSLRAIHHILDKDMGTAMKEVQCRHPL